MSAKGREGGVGGPGLVGGKGEGRVFFVLGARGGVMWDVSLGGLWVEESWIGLWVGCY